MRDIPAHNDIAVFIHCMQCLSERPEDQTPREWARLAVGFTPIGLQIWCQRHDSNVLHIDFENQTHPVNGLRPRPKAAAQQAGDNSN